MAKPILTDDLWAAIEPLLPVHVPSPKGGHPRVSDRAALTGILFVLQTGIGWEHLPKELGCGCGMTCWRRLRDWQKACVWKRLHVSALHKLRQYDQIEWERASIDSASVPPPPSAGITPAPTPPTGANSVANTTSSSISGGLPVAVKLSAANFHDSKLLRPLVQSLPAVAGLRGRPRKRPTRLHTRQGLRLPLSQAVAARSGHPAAHCKAGHRKH